MHPSEIFILFFIFNRFKRLEEICFDNTILGKKPF